MLGSEFHTTFFAKFEVRFKKKYGSHFSSKMLHRLITSYSSGNLNLKQQLSLTFRYGRAEFHVEPKKSVEICQPQ